MATSLSQILGCTYSLNPHTVNLERRFSSNRRPPPARPKLALLLPFCLSVQISGLVLYSFLLLSIPP